MKLSKKIRILRSNKGWTQEKFSRLLKVGYSSVANYENEYREPNYKFIQKLCQQFPEYTLWLMTDGVDIGSIKNQVIEVDEGNVL